MRRPSARARTQRAGGRSARARTQRARGHSGDIPAVMKIATVSARAFLRRARGDTAAHGNRTHDKIGLRDRNSPTCTLSQNGYGANCLCRGPGVYMLKPSHCRSRAQPRATTQNENTDVLLVRKQARQTALALNRLPQATCQWTLCGERPPVITHARGQRELSARLHLPRLEGALLGRGDVQGTQSSVIIITTHKSRIVSNGFCQTTCVLCVEALRLWRLWEWATTSPRLKRSSARAMLPTGLWRNGSASDSRSECWKLESLYPHSMHRIALRLGSQAVSHHRSA